jgi:hypothetical protein
MSRRSETSRPRSAPRCEDLTLACGPRGRSLVFNIMNRLANAFDLAWDSDEHVRLSAKVLHRIDYRLPSFLTR